MADYQWRGNPETGEVATFNADREVWGVIHPEDGGHWAKPDEVQDWSPIAPTPAKAKK